MVLPVTLTIAAACAVINIWLAIRLVRGRVRGKVMVGDGGDPGLLSGCGRTRTSANTRRSSLS